MPSSNTRSGAIRGRRKVLLHWRDEKISGHWPAAFQLDGSAWFKDEPVLQSLKDGVADLNTARDSMRFEPAGGVHGVAPGVINKLADANDAGDDAPHVQPDAQTQAAEF